MAEFVERHQALGHWLVLAVDYEFGLLFEPILTAQGSSQGLARAWAYAKCDQFDATELANWLDAQPLAAAGIAEIKPCLTEGAHAVAVDRVREYIAAGDCYQVNLTFPLDLSWYGRPLDVYRRLREGQPVRFGGFVGGDDRAVLSLSPELFFERRGEAVTTRPMKGTAPRSEPMSALAESDKDRAENLMIVDLLRNDLGRIAQPGSVTVDELFAIEAYPSVWQMVSSVSAQLGTGIGFMDMLRALFPCGSVTGAPKIRAMQIIAELERFSRGLYTGSLGWLAPNGDCRLNVAIRTLELEPGGVGRMGVGSGIVTDSVPAAEWAECQTKTRFLQSSDPGLRLIETLRRENGQYPRLSGHLARLVGSARALGFDCDEKAVRAALHELAADGLQRVRLTLGRFGDVEVSAAPFADFPAGAALYARLAKAPIQSGDPLRRYKTTERGLYDAALSELAASPEVFDMVFLNERGEVAEGARSNVFVEREGVLLTPPLSSGALPGVLRGELLASGRAREAVLRPADLACGFLLGNALRGLLPVTWARETA